MRICVLCLMAFGVLGCSEGADTMATGTSNVEVKEVDVSADGTEQITGRCHCGAVEYMADGPIVQCSYCDCEGCRRSTGTLKARFVPVRCEGV